MTYQIIRDSIDLMIRDLIKNTKKNLKKNNIKKIADISKSNFLIVNFSDKIKNSEKEIKYFLKVKMYNNKNVVKKIMKVN